MRLRHRPARWRPSFAGQGPSPDGRARGKPGADCTRSLVCKSKNTRVSHHRFNRIHTGLPRANGFNGFLRTLPGVPGLIATVTPEKRLLASHELDLSVGRSGPYDFAVREDVVRLATPSRPSHPAPNVRDDAQRRSCGARDGGMIGVDLPDGTSGLFFSAGLDDPNQLEMLQQNRGFGAGHFAGLCDRMGRPTPGNRADLLMPYLKTSTKVSSTRRPSTGLSSRSLDLNQTSSRFLVEASRSYIISFANDGVLRQEPAPRATDERTARTTISQPIRLNVLPVHVETKQQCSLIRRQQRNCLRLSPR